MAAIFLFIVIKKSKNTYSENTGAERLNSQVGKHCKSIGVAHFYFYLGNLQSML